MTNKHNYFPFSIIIPCYNEEENIINLYKEIKNTLTDHQYEIIYTNDCSNDGSKRIIEDIIVNDSNVKLINNIERYGQSRSILLAVKSSSYNYFFTLDGDGQNNPKDILKIINIIKKDDDLIYGIRLNRKDSFSKVIASKIANRLRSFILKDNCLDTGCGIKFFKKKSFTQVKYFNGNHRFYPALFIGKGLKVRSISVDHRSRLKGQSKYGNFSRAIKGIVDIYRVFVINKKNNNV